MNMQHPGKFRIKDVVFEEIKEDGTVVEQHLADHGWDLGHIKFAQSPEDPDQRFWIASDHSGLMEGKHVIASPVPEFPVDPNAVKDRTNTLIGLIRDGACQVFASYDIPELAVVK
jgi:hypothetical protein